MKIISGGQTGADRAAFDFALDRGLEIGGWVPRGRQAEDGPIPAKYTGLQETESEDPAERTRLNVRDSDATLILSHGPLIGGSLLTLQVAEELQRPRLHLDLNQPAAVEKLRAWLGEIEPQKLNVAGPRATKDPRISSATLRLLREALASN